MSCYSFEIKTFESNDIPDFDEIMLHASFQCLVNFMQEELWCDENGDWNFPDASDEESGVYKELINLYTWWTKVRPKRVDPLDNPNLLCPPEEDLFEETPDGHCQIKKLDPVKYDSYLVAVKESTRLEEAWEEEDQINLLHLFRYRLYLWV